MLYTVKNNPIIVSFHYIENPKKELKGIHPCLIKDFDKKIKFLSQNYAITNIKELYQAAFNNSEKKLCALTFDDGLRSQYENALPILKKYGVKATFFPITATLNGFLPSTHKIHILLSKFKSEELVDKCNNFFEKHYTEIADKYRIPKDKRITLKRKLRDDIPTANFKETINILPNNIKDQLLTRLFDDLNLDEKKISKKLFMNEKEIKDLINQGFEIGGHGHKHYALDFQTKKSIKEEIKISKAILEKITNKPITIFSYPHGGVNEKVVNILKQNNFIYAVNIERNSVKKYDNPFLLPRYDVNDIII